MSKASVLIAEDHMIVRSGIKLILSNHFSITDVAEVDNLQDLLTHIRKQSYDLLILDVFLTDGNSVPLLQVLKAHQPDLKVLYFTMLPEAVYGRRLVSLGASGFLNKQSKGSEIVTAINEVLKGNIYLSEALSRRIAEAYLAKEPLNPFDQLSDREFEVMLMLLGGKQMKEIAADLGVQATTIATYKNRIFEKLNTPSLLELNKLATLYNLL